MRLNICIGVTGAALYGCVDVTGATHIDRLHSTYFPEVPGELEVVPSTSATWRV